MSTGGGLEASYRRLLRCYPAWYRGQHEEEILGVLMTAARPGQRRPGVRDWADLLWSALKIRARTVLRGAASQPWADALTQFAVLLPLLLVVLRVTELCVGGAKNGIGSPADILIGAYGDPGAYTRGFQLNPFSAALTGNVTDALTAGPLPPLVLAVLVGLGLRRAAAALAACVPLAFLTIALTNDYTLAGGPRTDGILYAWALESLALLASPGTARGWKALRWRPGALLAAGTAALSVAVNGGFWPLVAAPISIQRARSLRLLGPGHIPRGFLDRLLGTGPAGLGDWLLAQGTLIALIVVVIVIMLVSSPVNRRVLVLLAVPFALESVIYACSLVNPPLPAAVGNTIATLPLLVILMAAIAVSMGPQRGAGAGTTGRPTPSSGP
ncbi:MAG TPA: hypothetical protein VN597_17275 [Streptosporangiaceae bacterium]|nr:hypothetical protein [Streptosporangiaceae bacterium]